MGHLINPISMRLGWFSDWLDVWYSDNIYYTEYFYAILKIRLYLIFFWGDRGVEKAGMFYSHFNIVNEANSLIVNSFIYDGQLEGYVESFIFNNFRYARNFNLRRDIFVPYRFYNSLKMLIILNWFVDFALIDDLVKILKIW